MQRRLDSISHHIRRKDGERLGMKWLNQMASFLAMTSKPFGLDSVVYRMHKLTLISFLQDWVSCLTLVIFVLLDTSRPVLSLSLLEN